MNHRIGQFAFALLVGVLVGVFSYRWITDPAGREARVVEVQVVQASRQHLALAIGIESLELVDPLARDRKVGKAYVYPEDDDWVVSGFYRRDEDDRWHPYLMSINSSLGLLHLKTADKNQEFLERAKLNPLLEVLD
jgi:hypothetical protein